MLKAKSSQEFGRVATCWKESPWLRSGVRFGGAALLFVSLMGCDLNEDPKEPIDRLADGSEVEQRFSLPGTSFGGGTLRRLPLNDRARSYLEYATSGSSYNFVVIGDPEPKEYPSNIHPNFEATLQEIENYNRSSEVSFVVVVGDLVNKGTTAQYEAYYDVVADWMDETQIPVFSVMGNHDNDDASGFENYRNYISSDLDFFFDYADGRFLGFNNTRSHTRYPYPVKFGVDTQQVNRLDTWLSNAPENRFVFTHIPFHENSWESSGANLQCTGNHVEGEHRDYALPGYRNFHELFKKHEVRASFAGHVHWYNHESIDGIRYFTTGGAGGGAAQEVQSRPHCAPTRQEMNAPHWLSVHVDEDSDMTTEVHALGRGRNENFQPGFCCQTSCFDGSFPDPQPRQPGINLNSRWIFEGSNSGDSKVGSWSHRNTDRLHVGDFNGDGEEELFLAQSHTGGTWMALKSRDIAPIFTGEWDSMWSNAARRQNHSLFPYRNHLIVGDYDGDGEDELLGDAGWTTMFNYRDGDFRWGWSDYGNTAKSIRAYKGHLIAGDFDGDGKDELLGDAGWTTMFNFTNGDFRWGWSDYGNSSNPIRPYKGGFSVGDFDGDGQDELLGISGSKAAVFKFENGQFVQKWDNGGSGWLGGWNLSQGNRHLVIGDFDTNRVGDELLLVQKGSSAAWSAMLSLSSDFSRWNWGWSANPSYSTPYLGDWPVGDGQGGETGYLPIKTATSSGTSLLAHRIDHCGDTFFNSYRFGN